MIRVSCRSLFSYCQPPGAGAFSGDFTTNLARQCRTFSRALKIEKLKAPLFRCPEGAGATNDWCINTTCPRCISAIVSTNVYAQMEQVLISLWIICNSSFNCRLPMFVVFVFVCYFILFFFCSFCGKGGL